MRIGTSLIIALTGLLTYNCFHGLTLPVHHQPIRNLYLFSNRQSSRGVLALRLLQAKVASGTRYHDHGSDELNQLSRRQLESLLLTGRAGLLLRSTNGLWTYSASSKSSYVRTGVQQASL